MSDAHEFKTQNMALAAALWVHGYEYDRLERVMGGCQWVYDSPNDEFRVMVEEYHRGEDFVEPVEFVRKLGLVRAAMYEFLGHRAKRIQTKTA